MIVGTSAVIDGMMAVIQRVAHNRTELTVEEWADFVQKKQAACVLRELSKPDERSQPRSNEKEMQRKRGTKRTHANEATTKRKSPTRNGQRRRGEPGDEGGSCAGSHTQPERNLGRNERDSLGRDAGREAAHSMSEGKNWPLMHDLSRTVATRIIKIHQMAGEGQTPGPISETIHDDERETYPL